MPELHDRTLGTSQEHKVSYAIHQTGSRLAGDLFLASYLADSLRIVDGLGPMHKLMLAAEGQKRGHDEEQIRSIVTKSDDTLKWVAGVKDEGFHRTNVLSFLSFWAAQEAGNENVIAAILASVESAAAVAASKFKAGRYSMSNWPWDNEQCLEMAQKLDAKAREATPDGGWDVAARLVTLYAWLGATISIESGAAAKLNEANLVRNVLLHRYGRLGPRDIERVPHLVEYANGAIRLSGNRLSEYYQSVVAVLKAITSGAAAAGWK